MIRELSWYIESGRFTRLLEELEEKAAAYALSMESKKEDAAERGEEFRALCRWHMKKSGWRADEAESIDTTAEFFDGTEINRKALNNFEKEIVKAHMYQKHLWEFMGTTGCMTVISKNAMAKDGFSYNDYLPIEHRKNHPPQGPLFGVLNENPQAVPIYQYLDGGISSEYDSRRAGVRFDALKDRSGFDWSCEGWNPNYEVEKNGWHGEYHDGTWTCVREDEASAQNVSSNLAEFSSLPELIRDGDGAILYDIGRSLISPAMRVWLLEDGNVYGGEKINFKKTSEMIQRALDRMGVENITAVCAGTRKKKSQAKTMAAYRAVLGDIVSPSAVMKTAAETEEIRRKFRATLRAEETGLAGRRLFCALQAAVESGARGEEAVRVVKSGTVQIPRSLYDEKDRNAIGLTEADSERILSYRVPEEKRAAFTAVVMALLKEEALLATGGISRGDILDIAYSYVVQGKRPEETVNVETTFADLCSESGINLRCDKPETNTLAQLEEARKSVPVQPDGKTQLAVDVAIASVIRNFAAVRMSTGMTPEEAVRAAVRIAGGKTGKERGIPHGGIEYVTPESSGMEAGNRRIFSEIPLGRILEESARREPETKTEALRAVMARNRIPGKLYSLFSREEREAWYGTDVFRKSGLSKEQAEKLASEEFMKFSEETAPTANDKVIFSEETEFDERYGFAKKQDMSRVLSVKILPDTARVSAQEATDTLNKLTARQRSTDGKYNLLSKKARKEFYKTEEFQASGLTEKEIDDFVLSYIQQEKTGTVARTLLVDAILFKRSVRRAKENKENLSPKEVVAEALTQRPTDKTYNLLSEEELAEFYETEEFKSIGTGAAEAKAAIRKYIKSARTDTQAHERLIVDLATFARVVAAAGNRQGGVLAEETLWTTVKRGVFGSRSAPSEPFRAFIPSPSGGDVPLPVITVLAEQAVQARKRILARKIVERRESSGNFSSKVQRYAEADGNSFFETNRMTGHVENSPHHLAEHHAARKIFPLNRQDTDAQGSRVEEKKTDIPKATRGIPSEEVPDMEMQRMARLNAAYEKDRAVLAKQDSAFSRSKARDIGHAEGSGEMDSHTLRKILSMEKADFMIDLEKDTSKGL